MVDVQIGSQFQHTKPVELFTGNYYFETYRPQYDIHPDGDKFLMIKLSDVNQGDNNSIKSITNWLEELKRLAPVKK